MKIPPRLAKILLNMISKTDRHYAYHGDIEEIFNDILAEKGIFRASLWYWGQIFKSLPSFFVESAYWKIAMMKNYAKISLRHLIKYKAYSFINISGLAAGMASCLLIMFWVIDELSFDKFHDNAKFLYRIEADENYSERKFHVNSSPYHLAPILKDEIPEIKDASRFTSAGSILVRYKDKAFFENRVLAADHPFFQMFSFPLISGNPETVLNSPHSIVISEKIAIKYFSDENPIGKTLSLNNRYDYTVAGIVKNPPHNTVLQFDILVPYEFLKEIDRYTESWGNSITTYVLLHQNSIVKDAEQKIAGLIHKRSDFPDTAYLLFPLTRIRLHEYRGYNELSGKIQEVYIFSLIACFVLLIACINFMNLSTARSAARIKEIGMRKVIGATRTNVVKQFYGESIIYSFIALLVAGILVSLLLPVFNSLSGKELSITMLNNWSILFYISGITLCTGIIAGSYPSLYLSSFQPVNTLKTGSIRTNHRSFIRKGLVIFQFTLSVILIIGTMVVLNQLRFMKNRKIGYDKEHVIFLPLRGDVELKKAYETLKSEFLKNPQIGGVTATSRTPAYIYDYSEDVQWDGKNPEEKIMIRATAIENDFIETLKIELVEGRGFSQDYPNDRSGAFLVNEEVVKPMGVESAVGKNLSIWGIQGQIVGVIKNFHFQPLRSQIESLVLIRAPNHNWLGNILIRLEHGEIRSSLNFLENKWKEVVPNYPFEYRFLNEIFDRMYRTEERIGDLLNFFTILSVLIACLGLFGLASFMAEQRIKEIGIRKVLGASVFSITRLLCAEFLKLVFIANLIAWPAAYFILRDWLKDFAYRIELDWKIFFVTGLLAMTIALITVIYQSLRAASTNPINALNYE